jgi:hypothetical protein
MSLTSEFLWNIDKLVLIWFALKKKSGKNNSKFNKFCSVGLNIAKQKNLHTTLSRDFWHYQKQRRAPQLGRVITT